MKKTFLYLQAVFYEAAGCNHFRKPLAYDGMIPPYLPWHSVINLSAGSAEILLGVGLLFSISRKWVSYGIIAMLVAYIPAHIYFLQIGSCITGGICVPQWAGWLRLIIIHPLLILWAWWCRK